GGATGGQRWPPPARETVAATRSDCPTPPRPSPLSAPAPAIVTTPPRPTVTPRIRRNDVDSCRIQANVMTPTNSGAVELRTAARPLSTDCCPNVTSMYGMRQPTRAWMERRLMKVASVGILLPDASTITQSVAAASTTRPLSVVHGGI